mmetsp:Transcript_21434/g.75447  ORF Transcript_21434/g.75447 Transcript_21434/m.75447 type:complete len:321 (+) Transcript_21434:217-1179(+)
MQCTASHPHPHRNHSPTTPRCRCCRCCRRRRRRYRGCCSGCRLHCDAPARTHRPPPPSPPTPLPPQPPPTPPLADGSRVEAMRGGEARDARRCRAPPSTPPSTQPKAPPPRHAARRRRQAMYRALSLCGPLLGLDGARQLDAERALHLADDDVVGDGLAALVQVDHRRLLVDAVRQILLLPALGRARLHDRLLQVQTDRRVAEVLDLLFELVRRGACAQVVAVGAARELAFRRRGALPHRPPRRRRARLARAPRAALHHHHRLPVLVGHPARTARCHGAGWRRGLSLTRAPRTEGGGGGQLARSSDACEHAAPRKHARTR